MNSLESSKRPTDDTRKVVVSRHAGEGRGHAPARNAPTKPAPGSAAMVATRSAAPEPSRTLGVPRTRVFIVDDHALLRRGLAALIGEESDMEVCGQAEDAASALQEVIKLQPDIVIVDISLKGNSGLELIKSIKAHSPKIQILVLSMHHESIYALRALKAGARGYVMKQEVINKVLDGIRRLRKGHLCVSDEVASQMLNGFVGGDPGTDSQSLMSRLSDRELEIVNLIGNGLSTREIATKLHVSVKTVETHRAHVKEKLGIRNATQLVQTCVRWVEENNNGNHAAPRLPQEVA